MIKTIEEAAEMWCPFSRISTRGGVTNRDEIGDTDGRSFCLSYACMAFRWFDEIGTAHRRGYCGLAGGAS